MDKAKVLVIGNSGVGKTTLIEAVQNYASQEDLSLPFEMIDTAGFEPSLAGKRKTLKGVQSLSKKTAITTRRGVQAIWFCIDGTSRKLFDETMDNLEKSIGIWQSVPIIAVITKSYSMPDQPENERMVKEAFETRPLLNDRLEAILPVVAKEFVICDGMSASPQGIDYLIRVTTELIPLGLDAGKKDAGKYRLARNRRLSHGAVMAATAAAVIVGAVPIPFADAVILVPIETAEIDAIAKIYHTKKGEDLRKLLDVIVGAGTVGIAAKAVLSGLKAIPGISLEASVFNAVVAGSFVYAVGEGSIYIFEQVYLGKKSLKELEWAKQVIEETLESSSFYRRIRNILNQIGDTKDPRKIADIITKEFFKGKK